MSASAHRDIIASWLSQTQAVTLLHEYVTNVNDRSNRDQQYNVEVASGEIHQSGHFHNGRGNNGSKQRLNRKPHLIFPLQIYILTWL